MGGVILIFAFAMSLIIQFVERKITDGESTEAKATRIAEKNIVGEPE